MEVNLRTAAANADVQIVEVQGRIDAYTHELLEEHLASLLGIGTFSIVCNLAGVDYISGHGLKALLKAIKDARSHGGDVKLACPQAAVERTFHFAGFGNACKIFKAEDDAVRDFSANAGPGPDDSEAFAAQTLVGAPPDEGLFSERTLVGDQPGGGGDVHAEQTLVEGAPDVHAEQTLVGGAKPASGSGIQPDVERTILDNIETSIHFEQTLIGGEGVPATGVVSDDLSRAVEEALQLLEPYAEQGVFERLMRGALVRGMVSPQTMAGFLQAVELPGTGPTALPELEGACLLQMSGKGRFRSFSLVGGKVRIGRAKENDIVLSTPEVSNFHAEVEVTDGGVIVRDLGSTNGITVNTQRHEEAEVESGDVIGIGPAVLLFMDPEAQTRKAGSGADASGPRIRITAGPQKGTAFAVAGRSLLMGRDSSNDMVLEGEDVAPFHAQLSCVGNAVWLTDLKSESGIKVGGTSVHRRKLENGDAIAIGDVRMMFEGGDGDGDNEGGGDIEDLRSAQTIAVPPAAATAARFVVIEGEADPASVVIGEAPIVIGRAREADICVEDDAVSRRHAQVERTEKGVLVVDLGSHNGVLVNGKKVKKRILKPGATVQIGHAVFRLEA